AAADLPDDDGTLVCYQTGAVGVEPIVYVLAPTAADAARVVRGLL
ncbi:DNA-binding protein, partial [Halorubrum pallidum]